MRCTKRVIAVLTVLRDAHEVSLSGADVMRKTGLPSGTTYPLLLRLAKHGLVQYRWEDGTARELKRPRSRLYKLTAKGRDELDRASRPPSPSTRILYQRFKEAILLNKHDDLDRNILNAQRRLLGEEHQPMKLVTLDHCPFCGSAVDDHPRVYPCAWMCIRTSATKFMEEDNIRVAGIGTPHLHATCENCGFVWLAPAADPAKILEIWR